MLAGCSSPSLLSPTRRLRSEAATGATTTPATVHFPMNTQRLDLQCSSSSFTRKETPSNRPLGRSISLDNNNNAKPIESRKTGGCSLKQNIKLPPLATTRSSGEGFSWNNDNNRGKKNLKRLAEEDADDESCLSRGKRLKGETEDDHSRSFWFEHFTAQNSSPALLPFSLTCSGEDDDNKVCFAPSEVISAPLPSSNPNWVDSVITELAGIGDKDATAAAVKEASNSSTSASSESRSLSHRVAIPESTNGSRNPHSHRGGNGAEERINININNERNNDLQRDFELVNLLTGCLEAIRSRNIAAINHFIARAGDLASPRGRTPMTRLIAYYIEALALRVARMWPHIFHIAPPREFDRTMEDESGNAFRFLNQVTPIPKFIHYTANEMLLRAFEGKERVHIIDFDIKQGLQWPSFFQSLASRSNPPHHVRITGIGESKLELNETGDRLHGFAEAMNLQFEFHPVVDRLEDVRLWMLHVKEGESVAVNCVLQMHKTLYDGTGAAIRDFVGLIRSTNPIALVLAEQEAEHNSVQLETRVCNSLRYYSAMFDAIHTNLGTDSLIRVKIEEMLFGREIRNIVACEGSHRQERHVGYRHWRRMLEQLGCRNLGVTEREVSQSKMLLRMYGSNNEGFFNVERRDDEDGDGGNGGGITLRWSEQPLFTISAWTIGGSSSSFSQRI